MNLILTIVDVFLHLDKHLSEVIQTYGVWTYALLFFVIFLETGFVVTPFLPGDSLLFAAGTFAAAGAFHLPSLILLVFVAAVMGDTANYWIGHQVGPRVFREDFRLLNRKHLERTHDFYERHGGKTIFLARFIPIIRTFAPFVAGIGAMSYPRFLAYNLFGGLVWTTGFTLAGYFFGNIPFIKHNFSIAIMVIILISVLPMAIEYLRHRARSDDTPAAEAGLAEPVANREAN
jgi:membrane-associated protein